MFNNLQINDQGEFVRPVPIEDIQDRISFLTRNIEESQASIDRDSEEVAFLSGQLNQFSVVRANITNNVIV